MHDEAPRCGCIRPPREASPEVRPPVPPERGKWASAALAHLRPGVRAAYILPMTDTPYRHLDDKKLPTEDEQLLESPPPQRPESCSSSPDPWRVLRIMGEFV